MTVVIARSPVALDRAARRRERDARAAVADHRRQLTEITDDAAHLAVLKKITKAFEDEAYRAAATAAGFEPPRPDLIEGLRARVATENLKRGWATAATYLRRGADKEGAAVRKRLELPEDRAPLDHLRSHTEAAFEHAARYDVMLKLLHAVEFIQKNLDCDAEEGFRRLREVAQDERDRAGRELSRSTSVMHNVADDHRRVAWYRAANWIKALEAGCEDGRFIYFQ